MVIISCGVYSFTGASIPEGTETFQVNYFDNVAGNRPDHHRTWIGSRVYNSSPGFNFKSKYRNLNLVTSNGDLVYEGEIAHYKGHSTTSTANNTAAHKQVNHERNVRYTNKLKERGFI